MRVLSILLLALTASKQAFPETGSDAWLRYSGIGKASLHNRILVTLDQSEVASSAQMEIVRALQLRTSKTRVSDDMVVLGTVSSVLPNWPDLSIPKDLIEDGYWIKETKREGHRLLVVTALNDRGVLYGVFALLRHLALHQDIDQLEEESNPHHSIRWVNEWDNLDGSIERGYAGKSIFFAGNNVVPDLTRAAEYARLLASLGINGCTVNNVNANPRILSSEFLPQLARIAAAFRPWGVKLSISVPFSSPKAVGRLDTFDPLDARVQRWWASTADEVYRTVPDLAGFLVKADSEGQLGPSTYGRSHADAANVLARALLPHRGIVIYRGFVYNHHLDWRNLKNDRAKAAFDNFVPLDGQFDTNAILQIKHGPIDFQTREPLSPLFSALQHTKEAMELQITQEYTGQQRHLCYLVPMWKQVLDFNSQTNKQQLAGLVGVSNVGTDANWLGADLAQANLFGFGRLAWNPELSVAQITSEWTRMTWGNDPQVDKTIVDLELESWAVYEGYTGPLGIGTLTDILHGHYGPGIETAENNGWGQWIRADKQGIGMDRTVATGTGYIGQYPPEAAKRYESLERCPDELLLFMHHVPYNHRLHSGKTVIQHVYDSHYAAAAEAQGFPERWKALRGKVDEQRYQAVLEKLQYQAGHAIVWRDAICNWFLRESNIPDERRRVGHYDNRFEAEDMQLEGYMPVTVQPWENASGGKAIACEKAPVCSAVSEFKGVPGQYRIQVQYFDISPGAARFELLIGDRSVKTWKANADLPGKIPNGDTSTRETIDGVTLHPGDKIRIVGTRDEADTAAIDYIEFEAKRKK